ncbi:MAG: YHS domain-containing (seleno)protein [Pseudomonadota bacterium]
MQFTRRTTFMLGGAGLLVGAFGAGFALTPRTYAPARVFVADGLAIRGTDPVAYFTEGAAVAGDPAITHQWADATWAFASTANRDRFAADPTAYAPQYGGFCAWAVAAKAELYSTQPANWAIVHGKLYLNFNDSVQAEWATDRPGFIAQGDQKWPGIVAGA